MVDVVDVVTDVLDCMGVYGMYGNSLCRHAQSKQAHLHHLLGFV